MSFKSGIIAHKPCWVAKAHRNHRNWVLRMRRLSKKPKQFQEDDKVMQNFSGCNWVVQTSYYRRPYFVDERYYE